MNNINADINCYPISSNKRPNINRNNNLCFFNVHSTWFRNSTVLHTECGKTEFPNCAHVREIKCVKKVGDVAATGETPCSIETEKTNIGRPSQSDGKLIVQYINDGETVNAKDDVLRKKCRPSEEKEIDSRSKHKIPTPSNSKTESIPKIEANQNALKIKTPPEKVMKLPSLDYILAVVQPQVSTKKITDTTSELGEKKIRKKTRIGGGLKALQNKAVMLTTFNEIDMSYIIAFRKAYQEDFKKKYGIKIGFMSIFLKAAAYALKGQPIFNASVVRNEIVYKNYIDISVVVAVPAGVVVPVVRNVSDMNFADIERTISDFREKSKKGKLTASDVNGGTFTICNVGIFGSLMGIPKIKPPQSAILGMHAFSDRPVAIKGQLAIRPMMYAALSYDHRLIEAYEAVLFLRKIKECVENPQVMIAGM